MKKYDSGPLQMDRIGSAVASRCRISNGRGLCCQLPFWNLIDYGMEF